jgi:AraC-like DNA-binding protein
LAGISHGWYARFERGDARLSLKCLARIADVLELDARERRELMTLALPELSHGFDASRGVRGFFPSLDDNALPAYGDYYRSRYTDVLQHHHSLASAHSFFMVYDRPAGSYVESASSDVTLQLVTRGHGGAAKLDFARGKFRADIWEDEFVVAPADVACTYDLSDSFDLLVVTIPLRRFVETSRTSTNAVERLYAQAWNDPVIASLAKSMWTEARSENDDAILFVDSAAFTIAARLAALAGRQDLPFPSLTAAQLTSVFEVMSSELPVAFCSLELLARRAGMEPYDFLFAFRRATNTTPAHYLTNVRIDRSRTLLATTELSVPEIAARVGLEDDERFARLFTKRMKCSPERYRAEHRH